MSLPPPAPTLFPYTTLFRSGARARYPNAPPARARVPPYPCGQRRQFVSLNLENHKGPTLPELGSWPHWAVFANHAIHRHYRQYPDSIAAFQAPIKIGWNALCPPTHPKERSEEHTSELQSRGHLVCRLLLETKKHEV